MVLFCPSWLFHPLSIGVWTWSIASTLARLSACCKFAFQASLYRLFSWVGSFYVFRGDAAQLPAEGKSSSVHCWANSTEPFFWLNHILWVLMVSMLVSWTSFQSYILIIYGPGLRSRLFQIILDCLTPCICWIVSVCHLGDRATHPVVCCVRTLSWGLSSDCVAWKLDWFPYVFSTL